MLFVEPNKFGYIMHKFVAALPTLPYPLNSKHFLVSFSFRPLRQKDSNFANNHNSTLKPLQFPQIHAHHKQNLNFSEYIPRGTRIHNQEQFCRTIVQSQNNLLAHEKQKTKLQRKSKIIQVFNFQS